MIPAAMVGPLAAMTTAVAGTTQVWDPSQTGSSGGAGTWDTSSLFWDTAGTTKQTWASGNDALFNQNAGTVTVTGGGILVENLLFNVSGYTISGGPLTLTGTTPTFTSKFNGSGTTTISSNLTSATAVGAGFQGTNSSNGFAVTGTNSYTGTTVINQVTVSFTLFAANGSNSSFGTSGNVQIGSGSSTSVATYVGTGGGTTDRLWTVGGTSANETINNNGSGGALNFSNTSLAMTGSAGVRTLNLGGSYAASANTFAEALTDLGTGASISNLGVKGDTWILAGTSNTYSGTTTIASGGVLDGTSAHAFGNTSAINVSGSGVLGLLGDASTNFTTAGSNTPYAFTGSSSGSVINVDDATSVGATVAKTMTIGTISSTSATGSLTYSFTGADNTSLVTGAVTGAVYSSGGSETISNSITAPGTLTLASYTSQDTGGDTLNFTGTGNTIITGAITPASSGTLVLAKASGGSLTLMGSSTYTGATSVTGSTLNGANAHAFGSTSGITISSTGILGLLGDASTSFTKSSDGTAYSILTSASGGTINVDDATSAGASITKTMTIGTIGTTSSASGVQFNFTGNDNTSLTTGTLSGPTSGTAGSVTVSNNISGGTLTLGGYTSGITAGGDTLTLGGTGTTVITGAITPSTSTLAVAKSSGGLLMLLGSSTYTGVTTITSSTIDAVNPHALGSTSSISINGAGTLGLLADASTSFTKSSDNSLYSIITTGSGAAINVDDATSAGASVGKTMTIGTLSTTSVSSGLTYNFTGADNSSLVVGAVTGPAATAAAFTTIANAISPSSGTLTIASYTGANVTGGESLILGGIGTTTVTGAITASGTGLLLSKTGTGTAILLGSSSFAGGTNISGGTLSIAHSTSIGTGTVNFTSNSATLNATAGLTFTDAVNTPTSTTAIFKNSASAGNTFQIASLISGAGSVLVSTTSNSAAGPIELSDDSNNFAGTFGTGYGFVEFTSVANSGAISALGAGTTSYSLGNSSSFLTFQYVGSGNDTTNRAINWSGTTGTLALDASGAGTVGYLASTTLRSGSGGAATLALQGSNTGLNTLAQNINDSTGGITSVTKTGAGTWVLTGSNNYTGTTNISAGKLVVNGSGTLGTGTTTITGGVLAGNGSTGSPTVINRGGTITAGSGISNTDTIGKLTTGAQTWNAGGTYVAKVSADGLSNDTLILSGLSIGASTGSNAFNINLISQSSTFLSNMQQLVLAFIPGASQGNFNTSAFALTTVGITADTGGVQLQDVAGTFGGISGDELVADPIGAPEPTSMLLLAAAAAPLALGRRRRSAIL